MKLKHILLGLVISLISWCALAAAVAPSSSQLVVLAYHEIDQNSPASDVNAVDTKAFVKQLEWLKGQGYHFVSVDDILADRAGSKPLPEKSVLLSFDDGYRSVYTNVFPVLKLFKAPAVIALVGHWLEVPDGQLVQYGNEKVPRSNFLSWQQIRELQASGLVEVASHSYDLHFGQVANPQGNQLPAATSQAYKGDRYETHEEYLARVRADLQRNRDILKAHLGKAPRVMVWPYGSYSRETIRLAAELGMPVAMTLDDGANTRDTPLSALHRLLLDANMKLSDFSYQFKKMERAVQSEQPAPSRIMHVDLDYIYDPSPARQEENLGKLLDRVKAMGPSAVYLQAFADPDGNGAADALYFPNRHLPMRADLFSRVAWQLRTRTGVKVYAWMPLLAFELPAGHPVRNDRVKAVDSKGNVVEHGYPRLTPYSAAARQVIREIYEDLGRSSSFYGLLFHDDATLSDYEDASPQALAAYRQAGWPDNVLTLRQDAALRAAWTRSKIKLLDDFSLELAEIVRTYQPTLKTARNLYAGVVMQPESSSWFGQSFDSALAHYDSVAVMAMPYMENAKDPDAWMQQLFHRVAAVPGALDKTVFELQSVDWRNRQPIPTSKLAETVRQLNTWGARHVAYYPDNLFEDQPQLQPFKRVFSMTSQPER